MSKTNKTRAITLCILVTMAIIFGFYLFNKDELIFTHDAQRILNRHREAMNTIVTYIMSEKERNNIGSFSNISNSKRYYKKHTEIPPEVIDAMSDFFKQATSDTSRFIGPVERLLWDFSSPQYEHGVFFKINSFIYGEDSEGVDVQIMQYIVFNDSSNAIAILSNIPGLPGEGFASSLGIEPVIHLEGSWYLVTEFV